MNVIMYHFVSSSSDSNLFSGMHGISSKKFEKQILHLINNGTPLIEKDIRLASSLEKYPDDNFFYLTFDDAFKQHFDNVYPILKDYGMQASFFIPTMAIQTGKSPIVEKQRLLQYNLFDNYQEFISAFCAESRKVKGLKNIDFFIPSEQNILESKNYLKQFEFYSNEERYFRLLRNKYLSVSNFNEIIESLFKKFFDTDDKFIEQYYLNSSEIKKMNDNGMIIGGHSHSHPFLNKLSINEIKKEIDVNINFLQKIINTKIKSFAYPYGAFNDNVIKCLEERSFDYAFDTRTSGLNSRYNIRRNDAATYFN